MKLKFVIAVMSLMFVAISPVTTITAHPVSTIATAGALCKVHNRTTTINVSGKMQQLTCLPAARGTRWTWQETPVNGRTCVKSGVIFKSLICRAGLGQSSWLALPDSSPAPRGLTAAQIIDALRSPLAKALLDFDMHGDGPITVTMMKLFENRYADYGLKIDWRNTSNPRLTILGQDYCFKSSGTGLTLYDEACS